MLKVQSLSKRPGSLPWRALPLRPCQPLGRLYSDDQRPPSSKRRLRGPSHRSSKSEPFAGATSVIAGDNRTQVGAGASPPAGLSLAAQLFPEETKRYEAQQKTQQRDVPPVPSPKVPSSDAASPTDVFVRRVRGNRPSREDEINVLALYNASPNLTEEDFRRLIPQGKHIEGWNLDQGDIIKVIPSRDLKTLAPRNCYYLLFSSESSAYTYITHAAKIHRLVSANIPSDTGSAIPPPPNYIVEGIDVSSAIQAYSLKPVLQPLQFRQYRPPLAAWMSQIVRHRGHPAIVNRRDKSPFEVRLTLEGDQIQPPGLRFHLMQAGRARGLSWSGDNEKSEVKISLWQPVKQIFAQSFDENGAASVAKQEALYGGEGYTLGSKIPSQGPDALRRRTPGLVYVVGFDTEAAAQSFAAYWHRRPLYEIGDAKGENPDDPPLVNAEFLW